MKTKHIVIDFGGTSTKILIIADSDIIERHCLESRHYPTTKEGISQLFSELRISKKDASTLIVTGGKSRRLQHVLNGLNVIIVNEIEAIGVGGLQACGETSSVVVSIGTGTAIVVARKTSRTSTGYTVQHVGGLALGGGTIMGLGKLLCNISTFHELSQLADTGQSNKVDLTVGDIVGGSIGIIPAELTAVNFGRADREGFEYSDADIASGLFTMVGQSIARLASVIARQHEIEPITVIGQVIENHYMQRVFNEVKELFGGRFRFAEHARYRVAEGAYELAKGQL